MFISWRSCFLWLWIIAHFDDRISTVDSRYDFPIIYDSFFALPFAAPPLGESKYSPYSPCILTSLHPNLAAPPPISSSPLGFSKPQQVIPMSEPLNTNALSVYKLWMFHRGGKILEASASDPLVWATQRNPGWCTCPLAHCLLPGSHLTKDCNHCDNWQPGWRFDSLLLRGLSLPQRPCARYSRWCPPSCHGLFILTMTFDLVDSFSTVLITNLIIWSFILQCTLYRFGWQVGLFFLVEDLGKSKFHQIRNILSKSRKETLSILKVWTWLLDDPRDHCSDG